MEEIFQQPADIKEKFSRKAIKALVILLELLAVGLVIYLILAPIYPALKYRWARSQKPVDDKAYQNALTTAEDTVKIINKLPENENYVDRIIITKIGVNSPIIRSIDSNYALARGAWLSPENALPGENNNVVISGHRFKYLPPNNLTFYLLDKLKKGDIISVIWDRKYYYYQVKETKIVLPTDIYILDPTTKPILTLYTCTPIFSEAKRLVVVSELIDK